ncbi:testis-specific gene 10 protein isoform X2 [Pogoniulus pusillus]|uniref:testis-specific gene 10 protein isoform X2 n=1 Tax=Pogoniulus pusillus TaxID=488313 RepID=UPI0030B95324
MSKKISSVQGVSSDPEILKILRECEELKSTLKKYERYVAEVQGNFTVLRAEREKIVSLYEQAQEEISRLRQEVIRCPRTPKSTVAVQAELRRVETERDTALSDFQRMTTERDSLREQLKISQETAFNEKAHLEQRIEELETAIENLDSERLEQMSKVALMKDTINSLETEIKRWTRRALDSEAELSQKETEYISLSLLNEKTEQNLSEAQQSLIKKKYEMQVIQEKIMILDEKIGNFSRQGLAQQEEICALKETVVQLTKEKATLQNSVEEGREKIATLEESLSIKVLYEKIAKYQNELEDMKLKAQDSNTDIVKLKGILKSKLRSKCKSSDSEIELLRKQLGTERASMKNLEFLLMSSHEKQFQSQRATHEKDSEIQFLKEQLSLGENKLAVQSQEFTHLRNRAAQLESELGITKRQLETEHFERERPVEELQHQTRTVSYHLRTSSPERSHLQPPDWSLEWSLDE